MHKRLLHGAKSHVFHPPVPQGLCLSLNTTLPATAPLTSCSLSSTSTVCTSVKPWARSSSLVLCTCSMQGLKEQNLYAGGWQGASVKWMARDKCEYKGPSCSSG